MRSIQLDTRRKERETPASALRPGDVFAFWQSKTRCYGLAETAQTVTAAASGRVRVTTPNGPWGRLGGCCEVPADTPVRVFFRAETMAELATLQLRAAEARQRFQAAYDRQLKAEKAMNLARAEAQKAGQQAVEADQALRAAHSSQATVNG